jgi:hypothetical protein
VTPPPLDSTAARAGGRDGLAGVLASAWPMRVAWLLVPLCLGPALGGALGDASRPVQLVASVGTWLAWASVLVATLVPTTLSLTVVRIGGPAAAAAGLAALVADGVTAATVVGAAYGLTVALVALAPGTAEVFADGSSYGEERRLPLRTPAALLAGPAELAWAVVVAGVAAGPLLLAARQWVAGALALAAGLPLAWLAARSLHILARRWLVFVPAGVVVHDPLALAEPVLFQRSLVRTFGPAPADTDALDLTGGAWGLAVEARLTRPVTLLRVAPRQAPAEIGDVTAVLVTPTRPGRVVAEARRRHLA